MYNSDYNLVEQAKTAIERKSNILSKDTIKHATTKGRAKTKPKKKKKPDFTKNVKLWPTNSSKIDIETYKKQVLNTIAWNPEEQHRFDPEVIDLLLQ